MSYDFVLRALLSRLAIMGKIAGCIDQSKVGKGLGKVANQLPTARLVFLAQQSHIIAKRQQPLEQVQRLLAAAEHQISVRQPKTAGEEYALTSGQAVVRHLRIVTQDEAIPQETVFDSGDRAANALVMWRQKSNCRQEQQAGVEFLAAVGASQSCRARHRSRVRTPRDGCRRATPPVSYRAGEVKRLGASNSAVIGEPSHRFGIGKMPGPAPIFP